VVRVVDYFIVCGALTSLTVFGGDADANGGDAEGGNGGIAIGDDSNANGGDAEGGNGGEAISFGRRA
jgi:hypothetical protein